MKNKKRFTNSEYLFDINEKHSIISKNNISNNYKINFIFSNEKDTDIMAEVIDTLTDIYVREILNFDL